MVDGRKIRELREAMGVDTNEFAEAIFVSQSFVSRMERGLKQPSIETLVLIAEYFDLPIDDLLIKTPAQLP